MRLTILDSGHGLLHLQHGRSAVAYLGFIVPSPKAFEAGAKFLFKHGYR